MDRPSEMQPARAEPIRLTCDDYLGFPDDGRRHELIDGEHLVTPAPLERHQRVLGRLFIEIGLHLRREPIGEAFVAPFGVFLSDHDVVEPDVLFVSNERRAIVHGSVYGPPDLVIEVVSPSSRRADEVTKRLLYDRCGVREYWVVDPEIDAVTVYRLAAGGRFRRVADLAAANDDALVTPLLPGLSVKLRDLFA